MTMRKLLPFLFVLLPLASCKGGEDPKVLTAHGRTELAGGAYETAEQNFRDALAAIAGDKSDPNYLNASMGLCEALANQGAEEADEARGKFLALAKESDKITDRHFNTIGGMLGKSKNLAQATEVLSAGLEQYPDSEHLKKLLGELGKMAEASGGGAALDALKGLGYVGD